MKRVLMVLIGTVALTGCYEKTPSKDQAIEIAKEEISMALCGDRSGRCISQSVGNAHISERLNDHTNNITVTFKGIEQRSDSPSKSLAISGGIVSYSFDAKNGKTFVKEISLWSDDSAHSIRLCGHNYTFCRK
ncbi:MULTISPECIES: hypothetical protein [unclassified Pantoea]|uniref:hypothetical protein n=1 Tax=unclassified Pantoea TaxID=2630326 RepID=UPI00226A587C|nr:MULTISPECIES: hypothetical protein [unclassified Pantoea]